MINKSSDLNPQTFDHAVYGLVGLAILSPPLLEKIVISLPCIVTLELLMIALELY